MKVQVKTVAYEINGDDRDTILVKCQYNGDVIETMHDCCAKWLPEDRLWEVEGVYYPLIIALMESVWEADGSYTPERNRKYILLRYKALIAEEQDLAWECSQRYDELDYGMSTMDDIGDVLQDRRKSLDIDDTVQKKRLDYYEKKHSDLVCRRSLLEKEAQDRQIDLTCFTPTYTFHAVSSQALKILESLAGYPSRLADDDTDINAATINLQEIMPQLYGLCRG